MGNNVSSYPNVNFTGTTTTLGNSDNTSTIQQTLKTAPRTPVTLIYSGSSLNSRNSIIGNNLSNFYLSGGSAYGLNVTSAPPARAGLSPATACTRRPARASTAGTMYGLYVIGGSGHTISGNFIGGSAPSAGGTALTANGHGRGLSAWSGIYLSTAGTIAASTAHQRAGQHHC